MGFNAKSARKPLDWHFAPYIDAEGVTPEPSSDQILVYWASYGEMLRIDGEHLEEFQKRRNALRDESGDISDLTALNEINTEYDLWSRKMGQESVARRIEMLARLCGEDPDEGKVGSPSAEQIRALPGALLDLFEQEMQGAITPKASTPDSKIG